jgi:hypothetical protein
MANYHLEQGKHYHQWPPFSTLLWVGEKKIERYVTFDASCAYDSVPYNATDVNKLFGLSFGFGGVHHNSARFGWRWSNGDQCIELLAYVYNAGTRNWDEQLRFPVVAQVKPGQRVYCKIQYTGGAFYFRCLNAELNIYGELNVPAPIDLPGFGLTHGVYFGGALTAPHDMSVQIDRT